jgi:hypothetical protein
LRPRALRGTAAGSICCGRRRGTQPRAGRRARDRRWPGPARRPCHAPSPPARPPPDAFTAAEGRPWGGVGASAPGKLPATGPPLDPSPSLSRGHARGSAASSLRRQPRLRAQCAEGLHCGGRRRRRRRAAGRPSERGAMLAERAAFLVTCRAPPPAVGRRSAPRPCPRPAPRGSGEGVCVRRPEPWGGREFPRSLTFLPLRGRLFVGSPLPQHRGTRARAWTARGALQTKVPPRPTDTTAAPGRLTTSLPRSTDVPRARRREPGSGRSPAECHGSARSMNRRV